MSEIMMKAKSFKKMDDPLDKKGGHAKYVCYVKANTISKDLLDWMETNPRQQNMKTMVAQKITDSLKENENFHELNRGIVLSADSVKFDNKTEMITIHFTDVTIHGDIDGGHTLRAIIELQEANLLEEDRYVFLEIFTGIESPVDLASARNTSNQVDLKSIKELENCFEMIKEVVKGTKFANKISYKMYEQDENNVKKTIDVREIIAIIMMFCQEVYPYVDKTGSLSDTQPVQCYTGKEATLKKFVDMKKEESQQIIKNMKGVIPTIFEIWDMVECNFNDYAKKVNKRYLTRAYAKYNREKPKSFTTLISQKTMDYTVPKGLIYPVVGAFRSLIQVDKETKQYSWIRDPKVILEKLGPKLVGIVLDEKTDSPEYIGKSSNLWNNLFKEVYIEGHLA